LRGGPAPPDPEVPAPPGLVAPEADGVVETAEDETPRLASMAEAARPGDCRRSHDTEDRLAAKTPLASGGSFGRRDGSDLTFSAERALIPFCGLRPAGFGAEALFDDTLGEDRLSKPSKSADKTLDVKEALCPGAPLPNWSR